MQHQFRRPNPRTLQPPTFLLDFHSLRYSLPCIAGCGGGPVDCRRNERRRTSWSKHIVGRAHLSDSDIGDFLWTLRGLLDYLPTVQSPVPEDKADENVSDVYFLVYSAYIAPLRLSSRGTPGRVFLGDFPSRATFHCARVSVGILLIRSCLRI